MTSAHLPRYPSHSRVGHAVCLLNWLVLRGLQCRLGPPCECVHTSSRRDAVDISLCVRKASKITPKPRFGQNGRQWVPLILFSTTWQTMSSLALLDKMAQHCVRTIAMEEAVSTIYLLGVLSVNITTNSYRHGSLWSFMPFLLPLPSSMMCLFLATQLNTHVHCQHVHSQKQIIIHPRKNGINQIRLATWQLAHKLTFSM